MTDRSQTFSYDQLNRISTAQTTATYSTNPAVCWGQAFSYDATGNWSNLLTITGVSSAYTGCTQGSLSVTVTTKNQISGDTYDAAGNLWIIPGTGGATYLYDTENQLTSTSNSSMTYVYDGDGNRVMKSGSKIYWYSGSEVLDETDTTGSVTNGSFNEYVFFGGARIARRDSSNNVFYYVTDQLGSSRVIAQVLSGQSTATMCYDADFEPFGGEHAYTNTCSQNYKFTGKERDTESNLDNFGARYYASTTGRFMTPDWALKPTAVPYAVFGDPQTLNLYTYVQNSPLNRIDADGHQNGIGAQTQQGGTTNPCVAGTSPGGDCQVQAAKENKAQNPCQSGNCNVKVVADTKENGTPSPWVPGVVERDVTYQAVDQSGNVVKGAEVSLHEEPLPGKEGGDAKNYDYCKGNGCSNSDPAPKQQGYLAAGRLQDGISQNRNKPAAFKQTFTVEGKSAKIIWPTKYGNVTALSQTVRISADRVVINPEVEK